LPFLPNEGITLAQIAIENKQNEISATPNVANINNLVLALIARYVFPFVPSARRFFAAHPDHALALLL